jgi:hypothetical protein
MSQTNTINLNDCWLYASYISKDGYGIFSYRLNNKWTSTTAHKALFESVNGNVPQGYVLDHLCRITQCINPGHLEIVTIAENTRRKPRYKTKWSAKDKCPHCDNILGRVQRLN